MTNEKWNSLHDATLETLEFRWASGEVLLRIRTGDVIQPHVVVVCSSVRRLECGRRLPWGFSVSINEVRGPTSVEGEFACLEIEMQSGDILQIEATGFSIS